MEEWQVSASEVVPLEHPKDKPATLCQASPILGCPQNSLPYKIPPIGKRRQLQYDLLLEEENPGVSQREPVPFREPENAAFISNLLAHNSMRSGGIQLLGQSHPTRFTVAPPYSFLLIWSDLSVSPELIKFMGHPVSTHQCLRGIELIPQWWGKKNTQPYICFLYCMHLNL